MAYTNIDLPTEYFDTKTYTGTGSNNITLSMDNVGWIWIKNRGATGGNVIFDILRGGFYTGSGSKPVLITNTTDAEQATDITSSTVGVNFGSLSTVIGSDAQGYNYNTSSSSYVCWHWGANGAGVSNTSGSITSTVSANTTSGFSIVSYTGTGATATVGHGLGVTPKMLIVKKRDSAGTDWTVWGSILGGTVGSEKITLEGTGAKSTGLNSSWFNNTAPTSTLFTVGTQSDVNGSGGTYIGYCFAEIKGYSKFGSYTGNGSTDGTFVYTGFKPAWIMVKETGNVNSWRMLDNKRSPINVMNKPLFANLNNAEGTADHETDFVSNGFKIRSSDTNMNRSGGTFIYMAFAENPFVSSKGIPTTAR